MRLITCVFLFTITSITFPSIGAAVCWEITDNDGKVSKVDDFWNIKNNMTEESILLIRIEGSDESIPIKSIRTIELIPARKSGLNFLGRRISKGKITFTDGSEHSFETELNLISRAGDEKSDVQLTSVQSIRKCEDLAIVDDEPKPALQQNSAVIAAETSPQITFSPDADVIYMVNGDILGGSILTKKLLWRASFATISISKNQINQITLVRENLEEGLLESRSGDKINGLLETKIINIKLSIGQSVEINPDHIRAIHFGDPAR